VLLPEPPEPSFWKASIFPLIIAIPVALLSHALIPKSPLWLWLGLAILFALCGAYSMYRKARYDASAHWEMNFAEYDRFTNVPRDVNVRRK